MVLDQQVPLEWAFAAPLELRRRLGRALDPATIAAMDPEALASLFTAKPALHRYPGSMAARVHELARLVTERYRGRTAEIWTGATSGRDLFDRIKELPGFGEQKAKIFVALLGKQLDIRPEGWQAVSAPFSDRGSARSVADITDTDSLTRVRAFKAALKAANKQAQADAQEERGAATKKAPAKKAPAKKASAKKVAAKKSAARTRTSATKKVAAGGRTASR
jgi:uncharacterized HhH-GPD family protein